MNSAPKGPAGGVTSVVVWTQIGQSSVQLQQLWSLFSVLRERGQSTESYVITLSLADTLNARKIDVVQN